MLEYYSSYGIWIANQELRDAQFARFPIVWHTSMNVLLLFDYWRHSKHVNRRTTLCPCKLRTYLWVCIEIVVYLFVLVKWSGKSLTRPWHTWPRYCICWQERFRPLAMLGGGRGLLHWWIIWSPWNSIQNSAGGYWKRLAAKLIINIHMIILYHRSQTRLQLSHFRTTAQASKDMS